MPAPSIPSNLPEAPLRWTISRAVKEIGGFVSAPTLAARLRDSGEQPDAGDCWSTSQVLGAVYGGDLHFQRIREVTERADAWALKNAFARGALVSRDEVMDLLTQSALAIRRVIETSPLPRTESNEILRTLAAIPIRVRAIAAAQSRNGNGSEQPARRKRGRPRKSAEPKEAEPKEAEAATKIN